MKIYMGALWSLLSGIAIFSIISAHAEKSASESVVSHTFLPEKAVMNAQQMRALQLPPGFKVNVFAQDLGNARMLAVTGDGAVLVTRMAEGKVTLLQDKNDDGVAEVQKDVVSDLQDVHGIALRAGQIYLATMRQLYRGALTADGAVQDLQKIGAELPDGGQHPRRTLGLHPDGDELYISVGSSCNNCEESNPEHATLLRSKLDGSERTVFATGLRNTLGFGWHPVTRELWGMDHGSDQRGDDLPPEELNQLVPGADYGWPFCHSNKVVDADASNPKQGSKKEYCAKSEPPILSYQAHSAPIGLVFYTGSQFPAEYRNDAFVTLHGSWNRLPATGYKVVRIRFQNGKPVAFEDFLTGFLSSDGKKQFGRPSGIAVAKDGALLISDDTQGIIYRVTYSK